MKNNRKMKTLEMLGKMAERETGKRGPYWPPLCIGIIYQPKRPKRK